MYSTNGQYHAIPTDPECHQRKRSLFQSLERTLLLRIFAFFFLIIIVVIFIVCRVASPLLGPAFLFDAIPKPLYIDTPIDRPLVIRLAIICRVDAFERRETIRAAVLDGVPQGDVRLEYKFFVGRVKGLDGYGETAMEGTRTMRRITRENEVHGDIVVLHDIEDVPERISEKRFAALRWANSVSYEEYDYAMTMDSDTFCRFRTLARRIRYMYSNLKPREEPILIGSMSKKDVYWQNTVRDTNATGSKAKEEDLWVKGPVYPYPVGIGYMLSSNLTATIMNADPAVPHHIHYPYDDVMIGSWIAALKELHNPSSVFQTLSGKFAPEQVSPTPYLPYAISTKIVDDKIGWHDYKGRGSVRTAHAIGWDTACVHRISLAEMVAFRGMEEVKMEWDY